MTEKTTYTKDELKGFKEIILSKIESAKELLPLMILTMGLRIPLQLSSNLKRVHQHCQKKKILSWLSVKQNLLEVLIML